MGIFVFSVLEENDPRQLMTRDTGMKCTLLTVHTHTIHAFGCFKVLRSTQMHSKNITANIHIVDSAYHGHCTLLTVHTHTIHCFLQMRLGASKYFEAPKCIRRTLQQTCIQSTLLTMDTAHC